MVIGMFLILCVVSLVLCVAIGPVSIHTSVVWKVILHRSLGIGDTTMIPENVQNIVWHLRIPRVLLGAMAGAALSLAGVAMQAFTKNPLADPYILGIASGASFGAVLVITTNALVFLGAFKLQLGAFGGAVFSILLVYVCASNGREVTPIRLVLVGIALSAMFSSFTNFLIYNVPNDAKVREVTFWMLGGLSGAKWIELVPLAVCILPSAAMIYCLSSSLNAMMMGDSAAVTLGVNVHGMRRILILISALLTGVVVAVAGCIGFVGLVIPHMVRALTGADHRKVVPLSTLIGAIFLVWVDVAARMVHIPRELPIGILTAMIGAPFFLWMIRTRKYTFGEKSS